MANNISIRKPLGALPASLARVAYDRNELSGGVVGGFGTLSFRNSKWRVKYRGDEQMLYADDKRSIPAPTVDLVLVRSSVILSKLFYVNGYQVGSTDKPDCWSNNGVTPDPTVPVPQSPSCTICPHNRFASRLNEQGRTVKGKRCSDQRRVAVVPLGDMANEVYGGPMLLKIPPASLTSLSKYDDYLK